jgi:phosphoribosylformylglycinamidine synthase
MENKMNRVIRSCIELNTNNPIISIHDQGAGGTANVTKEIVYNSETGTGAIIDLSKIITGDPTMNDLELWVSEYQEQNTILIRENQKHILENICKRENVPFAVIGTVDNSGTVSVKSAVSDEIVAEFPLEPILGNQIPKKTYTLDVVKNVIENAGRELEYILPDYDGDILDILSMPSVGSKRFLTNKVDRSVTGLVAQQQCVGPFHTPISDYSVIAQSHFGVSGAATAIGERPLIGVFDPRAMAGMALGEMLTNLIFAKITNLHDVRISGNWMWPLKYKGENLALYEACDELTKLCEQIGVAIDGGKDSLSMIYKEDETIIPSPRQLVLSAYAPMKDIRHKITPHFKYANSAIMFVDLAFGKTRMNGSAFQHLSYQNSFSKIANINNNNINDTPHLESANLIRDVFNIIQSQ